MTITTESLALSEAERCPGKHPDKAERCPGKHPDKAKRCPGKHPDKAERCPVYIAFSHWDSGDPQNLYLRLF